MTSYPQAIEDWLMCVREAKKKLGIPEDSFVIIKGELLLEAQKAYCAMGY